MRFEELATQTTLSVEFVNLMQIPVFVIFCRHFRVKKVAGSRINQFFMRETITHSQSTRSIWTSTLSSKAFVLSSHFTVKQIIMATCTIIGTRTLLTVNI